MNRFGLGLIVGCLLATLLISGVAWASNHIRLIVNGHEIKSDIHPQLINGRVFVPIRFVADAFGAQVTWDPENWAVIISSTSKDTIHPINVPTETEQPETKNPQKYKMGEIIDLTDTKIRVNNLTYAQRHESFVAGDGMKFALANMDVWISKPPKNKVSWGGNDFVATWHTKSGQELVGGTFTTGESMFIKENAWNKIIVAIMIRDSDEITAITIIDPLTPGEFFTVSY